MEKMRHLYRVHSAFIFDVDDNSVIDLVEF